MLHLLPPDTKSTRQFCKAHGKIRHAYVRNMLRLDKKAREESYGWVLLDNVKWLHHADYGVIIAVTGPKTLYENSAAIFAGAQLPHEAVTFVNYQNVVKLLTGVSNLYNVERRCG